MNNARVVITGMGILASNAGSAPEFADALRAGRCGIRDITQFDTAFPFKLGGEVDIDDADSQLDRVSRLAAYAGRQALADSALASNNGWRDEAGLCIGTSRGP